MSPALARVEALPADDRLPGLHTVMDPVAIRSAIARHIDAGWQLTGPSHITHVRYKPGTSCLVAYVVAMRQPGSTTEHEARFYAKSYTREQFDAAVEKLATHVWLEVPGTRPVFALPAERVILYAFPNDPILRGMRVAGHGKSLQRFFARALDAYPAAEWRLSDRRMQVSVVRYKPEKRAVLRVATPATHRIDGRKERLCVYVRAYPDAGGAGMHALLGRLEPALAAANVRVPRALGWASEERLLIASEVPGRSLEEMLAERPDPALARDAARALTALQAVAVDGVDSVPIQALADDARAQAEALAAALPEEAGRVRKSMAELLAALPVPGAGTSFNHGDFHPGQVLAGADAIGVLDFERAHAGDPCADAGNFIAHLRHFGADGFDFDAAAWESEFRSEYERTSRAAVDAARLRYFTALGAWQLAGGPFRRLEPSWRTRTRMLIERCAEIRT